MEGGFYGTNRVFRLMRLQTLLAATHPHGMTTREVAERLGVSARTARRDLSQLNTELRVPLHQVGNRWRVVEGFWLPPVTFQIPEAVALMMAARLMLRYADKANPFMGSAFEKVAAALPERMKEPVMEVVDRLRALRTDDAFAGVFATLIKAWAERRQLVITYPTRSTPRRVWPLFMEPNPTGHTTYLIAWDPDEGETRNFKVERISDVQLLDEHFTVPLGFSLARHLAHAWTIWGSAGPPSVVELRFDQKVAERVKETTWHGSQKLVELPDGSVRARYQVASTTEIKPWVLGWGAHCEVVRPASLREEIAAEARAMAELYVDPRRSR